MEKNEQLSCFQRIKILWKRHSKFKAQDPPNSVDLCNDQQYIVIDVLTLLLHHRQCVVTEHYYNCYM